MIKILDINKLSDLPKLKLAVIGHVEWMRFLHADHLPKAGVISHSQTYLDEPAGGGALAAVEMQRITKRNVHFYTALGKDYTGEKCYERLKSLGLNLNVSWRDSPTREGISIVDSTGDRAINVIGERLQPNAKDDLPWEELSQFDGVFITATDAEGIRLSRKAKFISATPRVGIRTLKESKVQLDLLVGSGLDPDEKYNEKEIIPIPKIRIKTEGALGGKVWPGGQYPAAYNISKAVDSYGCGDKFAAAVTAALAANWNLEHAISLGAHRGAKCAEYFGPYPNNNEI